MIAFNLQRPSSTPLNGPKSDCGTYRKCTAKLTMSVDGGKAEFALGGVEVSV